MFNGIGNTVFADVGPASDEQDVSFDRGGGVLDSIGIDTSKVPETYDPNSTDNPYGSDVTTTIEMSELVKFNTSAPNGENSFLYGDRAKLDGEYQTLESSVRKSDAAVSGPGEHAFIAGTDCDVTGSGRSSAVAIVYSNYRHKENGQQSDHNIYMEVYDPKTGKTFEHPFVISNFIGNQLRMDYSVQSQLQIAAGDFDNDSVDEIAVYVPSKDGTENPRVAIYDLTNGKECADPYWEGAWTNAWNYILPKNTAQIVDITGNESGGSVTERTYMSNFYNNIDLAAGDADNDGSCDLVISYGASDVFADGLDKREVLRSLPSSSVILYGSNGNGGHGGQMLEEAQELSYGDEELIRVSFAFGDLDGDGNEEMLMGGQLQKEQETNTSRFLGKFTYDASAKKMVCETSQNMEIVEGSWQPDSNDPTKKVFSSSNGWDGNYYSIPAMKTNLAVGRIQGKTGNARIYLDSVLYSWGSSFAIEDELDDNSPKNPKKPEEGTKGSAVFSDFTDVPLGGQTAVQVPYYEYGAAEANFTASDGDYVIVHRVANERKGRLESDAAVLVTTENEDGEFMMEAHHNYNEIDNPAKSSPVTMFTADTDIDSAVSHYTGRHKIKYSDPEIIAVLASAPYFKDVADYDSGNMLDDSETAYGESTGHGSDASSTFEFEIGVWTENTLEIGAGSPLYKVLAGISMNGEAGYSFSRTWTEEVSREFEVEYSTFAGEDAVVLISVPTEQFEYKEITGMVDEDGNVTTEEHMKWIDVPHRPATQTMSLDDYMEAREQYPDTLKVDLSKYLASKPGDPTTYPGNKAGIPSVVKDLWKKAIEDSKSELKEDDFISYQKDSAEGVGFGGGSITQRITESTGSSDERTNGASGRIQIGGTFSSEEDAGIVSSWEGTFGVTFGMGTSHGISYHKTKGTTFSGTVANMPNSAREYGYYFNWSVMEYMVPLDKDTAFPVVSYFVNDIQAPPKLPDTISQDYDQTTDSRIGLVWDYSEKEEPEAFDVYRYKDFPQGGGNELVGTVNGSDYAIRKDANGKTITDNEGNPIREYLFLDRGLAADTKYDYRIKVRRNTKAPWQSIFSPVIEARTDVAEKPELSLSRDQLTIYPDEKYLLSVNLKDPDQYEPTVNYQWQKYDTEERTWKDVTGCDKKTIQFSNAKKADAGQYRCRVNLVRKVSGAQYISAYSKVCEVDFSLRDVTFGPIRVSEGTGKAAVNTALEVRVNNASASGSGKPTGMIAFTLEGPNGEMGLLAPIDEKTGLARIDSIESMLGTQSNEVLFVNGGYRITAKYTGDNVFRACEDPEEYHYLRNIEECLWLSMATVYSFGKDVMPTTHLYDYRKQEDGTIRRTEITDQIRTIKFFAVDENGRKTGEAAATLNLADTKGIAKVPLNTKLRKRAWVEAYTDNGTTPAATQVIRTTPMKATLTLSGKISGTGQNLAPYRLDGDSPDVTISGDGSFEDKITYTKGDGSAAQATLKDLMEFKYYDANGVYFCDSTDIEADPAKYREAFLPAVYKVALGPKSDADEKLYKMIYSFNKPDQASFLVVGSYYTVSAASSDESMGSVRMIAPVLKDEIKDVGFSGGTRITLKAVPAKGFEIKGWTIVDADGTQYQNGKELLVYTLKSRATGGDEGKVTITARFQPKENTLTYSSKGNGSLAVVPAFASGGTVLEGTEMQFAATPDPGWHFKEWRWENYGGTSTIAAGTTENGVNRKTFVMGSTPAALYAVFLKDTIDLDLKGNLVASFINENENPLEAPGKEIELENGKGAPKGSRVRVKTAPGFRLGEDAQWSVKVNGNPLPPEQIEEFASGGRDGVAFALPEDVNSCSVEVATEKGYYSIDLPQENELVGYRVRLDGTEVSADKLQRISAGTLVEIQALPKRGKLFDYWNVDGEKQEGAKATLSFTIQSNVGVSAAVKDDESYTLKLRAEGEGTGACVITDHEGNRLEPVMFSAGDGEKQAVIYRGEDLSISVSADDQAHTMTALKMDGKSQPMTNGVFTLQNVTITAESKTAEFLCSFQPNTYHSVGFKVEALDTKPRILDSSGMTLESGQTLSVGTGRSVDFSVLMDKNYPCHVRVGEDELRAVSQEEAGNDIKYNYTLTNVRNNCVLTVDDCTRYSISSAGQFNQFMADMNSGTVKGHPYAVLTGDIDMNGTPLTRCAEEFNGTLDGQGFTVSGLKLGTDEAHCAEVENPSLFERIGHRGCVKNLTIDGYKAYYKDYHDSDGNALLAKKNYGVISGVALRNCVLCMGLEYNDQDPQIPNLGGLVSTNIGTIQSCQVTGLTLYLDRWWDYTDPDWANYNGVGSAVALHNTTESGQYAYTGKIIGCYVEGLKVWNKMAGNGGQYVDARSCLISVDGDGRCGANYYRAAVDAWDSGGTNVNAIASAEDQNKPAFAANLAFHINDDAKQNLWGVTAPGAAQGAGAQDAGAMITPRIFPMDWGIKDCKPPVKAGFKVKNRTAAVYLYPGPCKLPGRDSFGEDAPAFWQNEDVAYSADYEYVNILENTEFTGVGSLEDCVAELHVTVTTAGRQNTWTSCYSKLSDALADAEAHKAESPQLDIVGKCAMENVTFTIPQGMSMMICNGAELTMKKSASITNKGTFAVKAGSKFHKYGDITSTGTITIEAANCFINYGSKLKSTGTLSQADRRKITCKPHCMGEWKAAEQPNENGTWTRTSTCDVCTHEDSEEIPPNPPADRITSIHLQKLPQQEYKAGDAFSTEGMIVCAELKDGGRALITDVEMTITGADPKETKPIRAGDILQKKGTMQIAVNYESFSCGYEIHVGSAITAVTIADGPRTVKKGETLQLEAVLTPPDRPADITWTSSGESVATVDEHGLVTGHAYGQAEITVTADGLSDSCKITVYEPAETLELNQENMMLLKGSSSVLTAAVTPASEGEITWSVPDTDTAGFYVMNETTGQMEVAATAKTKLTVDSRKSASAHVSLAGVGQGETLVTATVEGAQGRLIRKTCRVKVTAASAKVTMRYEGKPVSGTMRTVDRSLGTMQFTAESSEANDTLQWSVIDNDPEPEIRVDDSGKVTLLRSGIATVLVTSAKTGAQASCILEVETKPQSIDLSESSLELMVDEQRDLEASLIPADADGGVRWSSSDERIAAVSQEGRVTAVGEGTAVITATATADPKIKATCEVTVNEAERTLELNQDNMMLLEGSSGVLAAAVSPASEGEIIWSVPDTTAAGFYVENETTGQMEVAATTKTKLTVNSKKSASAHVSLAGVGVGETLVTATIEDPKGTPVQKTCRVEVTASSAKVTMRYDNEDVSGTMRTVDRSLETMQFTAESSEANDTLQWSVVDNDPTPEITVDGSGKVTLLRSGIATVLVTSTKTGAQASCILKVETKPQRIELSEDSLELMVDEQKGLEASLIPADADGSVRWSSSNQKAATVSREGVVTAVGEGTAVITATATAAPEVKATCEVTVYEAERTLELSQENMKLLEGSSSVLTAAVRPATEGEIIWSVPDTDTAGFYVMNETTGKMEVAAMVKTKLTVNSQKSASAHVSLAGVSQGETLVTATIDDPKGTPIQKTCSVKVTAVSAAVTMLYEGKPVSGTMRTVDRSLETMQFTAESSEANDTLQWSVVDNDPEPEITVDDSGKVTLLRSGIATVLVTSMKTGAQASCILKIETKPQGVKLSNSRLDLKVGEQKALEAKLLPADADGDVRWSSSNQKAATVSQEGRVTAVGAGTAVITATATADPKVTANCKVTVKEVKLTLKLSKKTFYYNGQEQYPKVTVIKDGKVIARNIVKSNAQVLLYYDGSRWLPGKYTVTAALRDGSTQTAMKTYRIRVKPTKIKKLMRGKRQFTVKWKKQKSRYVTGYQIRYSLKQDMKGSKKKTVKKYKRTRLTVKKLKAKRVYYVQIRTYKKVNGKRYYSKWSEPKKVKTRK